MCANEATSVKQERQLDIKNLKNVVTKDVRGLHKFSVLDLDYLHFTNGYINIDLRSMF